MTKRDDDIVKAAQALCYAKHPSHTQGGTRHCDACMNLTMTVVVTLEDLGWKDSEAIRDEVSDAMDEG